MNIMRHNAFSSKHFIYTIAVLFATISVLPAMTLGNNSISLPPLSHMQKPKHVDIDTALPTVRTLAINLNSPNLLFAASEAGEAAMLDLNTKQTIWRAKYDANWQYYLNSVFSNDGLILAVAGITGVPILTKSISGAALTPLTDPCKVHGNRNTFGAMAFSSDSRLLAAAEFNQSGPMGDDRDARSVNIWDTQTGLCLRAISLEGTSPIHRVAFVSDNTMLVVQRVSGLSFFSVKTGEKISESLFVSIEEVGALNFRPLLHKITFSRDLRYAVAAFGSYAFGGDMREPTFAVALIDLQSRSRIWLKTIKGGIEDLAFSANGQEIAGFNLAGVWFRIQTTTGQLNQAFYEEMWLSETESEVGTPPPHVFRPSLDGAITVFSGGVLRFWHVSQ